jgi:integrase
MDARAWIDELARRWAQESLDEWETERALGRRVSDAEVEGFDVILDELRESLEACRPPKHIDALADELLAGDGRTASAEERALLLRLLMRAAMELAERQRARTEGDYSGEPMLGPSVGMPPSMVNAPEPAPLGGPTVSEAIARYVAAHEGKSWRDKMAGQAKVALRYFEEVVGGDTPLRAIGKDEVRRYREAMEKLPANVGSTLKYRAKTLAEILAMGAPPGLGPGTIKVYVQRNVGGLFNWARREGYVERNPAEGLAPKLRSRPRDERDAFTDADLVAIFSADFAELRDSSRPEDYWMPLLMLHTGARNEEVAQLRVVDVEELEGVPCCRIRDDEEDQQLKTATSRRTVPVHPFLIELGFMEYVAHVRRGGHERVFPNLRKGSNGFHDAASRRFNRRLAVIGIKGRKSAYSFRHTFGTRLRDADVPPEMISELLGHAHQTMTMGRYVKAPSPKKLLEAVAKLDLKGPLKGLLKGR